MKDKLQEFWVVIDSSWTVTLSIGLALFAPAVILILGSLVIGNLTFPPPFETFEAIQRPFMYFFLALAAIAFCQLSYAAYRKYQTRRRRLLGY